ncbi:MAG: hypothetical protein ACYC2T_05895 [Bacillota bacterium]
MPGKKQTLLGMMVKFSAIGWGLFLFIPTTWRALLIGIKQGIYREEGCEKPALIFNENYRRR